MRPPDVRAQAMTGIFPSNAHPEPCLAMKKLISALATSITVSLAGGTAHAAPQVELLVPAYFYPAGGGLDYWRALDSAAARVSLTAIINVNSGPGDALDPSYLAVVESLRAAGGRALGYLHTSWAARASSLERAEVDAYLARYPLDGFFIDEMATDPAMLTHYTDLYAYIKGRGAGLRVLGNPGTAADPGYFAAADVLISFEGFAADYAGLPPGYFDPAHAGRHGSIIHEASAAQMAGFIAQSAPLGLSMIYVTDDRMPDPYDTLPSYWLQEVDRVATIPAPGTLALTGAGALAWLAGRRARSRR